MDIQKEMQKAQEARRLNIFNSFSNKDEIEESNNIQKGHNEGDIHPNGKLVWRKTPSGYDWRNIKKEDTAVAPKAEPKQQKTEDKSGSIQLQGNGFTPSKDAKNQFETELIKIHDAYNNKKQTYNDFRKEYKSNLNALLSDTIVPLLPKGVNVDFLNFSSDGSSIRFQMESMGIHEIASLHFGVDYFYSRRETDFSKWLKNAMEKTYFNFYTTNSLIGSNEIERMKVLGKLAETFGDADSKPIKEYLTGLYKYNQQFEKQIDSLDNSDYKGQYERKLDEYLGNTFYRNFKEGSVIKLEKPWLNENTKSKRFYSANRVVEIKIDKIMPKTIEVTWTADHGGTFTENFTKENLIRIWSKHSTDGMSLREKWELKNA